jgi:outer membrane protein assembly factor BamE (lipoprotein component of BamABCDE complex)
MPGMTRPTHLLAALACAAALTACSSAPAPTPDAKYISDLGMTHDKAGEQALTLTGHTSVCDGLAHGMTKAQVHSALTTEYPQFSSTQADLVITTAVSDLCPAQAAHM